MGFIDPQERPVTRKLCEELLSKQGELLELAEQMRFIRWPEPIYQGKWDVSSFKYRHKVYNGEFGDAGLGKLPLINRPEIQTAGFSLLGAGAEIQWHMGQAGDVWRLHMGLDCPEGDCALQVRDDVRHWRNGEFLMFNDQDMHRAWNRTGKDRLILLVDVVKAKVA